MSTLLHQKTCFQAPLRILIGLILVAMSFLFPSRGQSQPLPPKVLFDGTQVVASWQLFSTEGASHEVLPDGVKFTIEAWQEGKNMWPRLQLQGPGIDLSRYSNVIVELENPTDKAESIAVSSAGAAAPPSSRAIERFLPENSPPSRSMIRRCPLLPVTRSRWSRSSTRSSRQRRRASTRRWRRGTRV